LKQEEGISFDPYDETEKYIGFKFVAEAGTVYEYE